MQNEIRTTLTSTFDPDPEPDNELDKEATTHDYKTIRRSAKLSGGIGFVMCYLVPISFTICDFSPLINCESRAGRHEPCYCRITVKADIGSSSHNY